MHIKKIIDLLVISVIFNQSLLAEEHPLFKIRNRILNIGYRAKVLLKKGRFTREAEVFWSKRYKLPPDLKDFDIDFGLTNILTRLEKYKISPCGAYSYKLEPKESLLKFNYIIEIIPDLTSVRMVQGKIGEKVIFTTMYQYKEKPYEYLLNQIAYYKGKSLVPFRSNRFYDYEIFEDARKLDIQEETFSKKLQENNLQSTDPTNISQGQYTVSGEITWNFESKVKVILKSKTGNNRYVNVTRSKFEFKNVLSDIYELFPDIGKFEQQPDGSKIVKGKDCRFPVLEIIVADEDVKNIKIRCIDE